MAWAQLFYLIIIFKRYLYILIPIYNLILAVTDSGSGENEYGDNPKD